MLNLHPFAHRLAPRAPAGGAVDGHDAVRALPGAAHQPAPAVVLEAARERALAGRVQRRPDRVALVRLDALAIEREPDDLLAVDPLRRLLRESAHAAAPPSPGNSVSRTSFVVVSRSAMNHARQPERWNH